jgi:hypothetical protein
MTRKRWLLVAGVAVLVAGAAAGLAIALTGGGGTPTTSSAAAPLGPDWQGLYGESHVGAKKADVLALWPKIPYQHYSDNFRDDCYEWQGDVLYNLCFKDGVLRLKTTF